MLYAVLIVALGVALGLGAFTYARVLVLGSWAALGALTLAYAISRAPRLGVEMLAFAAAFVITTIIIRPR